jgi:AmmeMemoRadiSam system protein B
METGKQQFIFGQTIKEAIAGINKNIAVICSADLAHRHASDAPFGFSPQAKEFDDLLVADLQNGSASSILQMDPSLPANARTCGYNAICLLLGILDRVNYSPELLSYEKTFGVGYCTMEFHLR